MFKPQLNNPLWPTMNPGEFRHRIILLEQGITTDIAGNKECYQPGNPPTCAWCKIEYVHGSEQIRNGQDVSQQFLKITTWYRTDFSPQSRIETSSGKRYIIQSVENVFEMNTYVVMYCEGIGDNN